MMWYGAGMVWYGVVCYGMLLYGWYGTVCMVCYVMLQYGWYSTVWHAIIVWYGAGAV